MLGYTVRRILWVIPVLWAVATITFFLMHAVPGGPFTQDKNVPPAVNEALNRRYHLDQPLWKQYTLYLWDASHGDLGLSFQGDRDVSKLLRDGFFVTAQLGIMGFLVAAIVGMTLGVLSALNQNGPLDYLGVVFATVGASVPNFIMGAFLVVVFSVNLHWLDSLGWGGPIQFKDIFDPSAYNWHKLIIPVVAVSVLPAAFIARVTRASMLEVLNQDYVRTARAKGLAEMRVIVRHSIKNAMIPVLTVMGPIAAALVTGSFIIEQMFSIPGVGRAFVTAVGRRDYAMIMGSALFYTLIVTIANLLVDLSYAIVDPRIRYR
ncbi:MAG TPA: ABC transporter permease [Dehalococcoidia bacterium]|nr:ABC transporter permease [Dehalococcoidia bacterium]